MAPAKTVCIPRSLVHKIIGYIHDEVTEDQRMAIEQKLGELTQNPEVETSPKPRSEYDRLQLIWEQNRKYFYDHEDELKEKYPGLYVAVHEGKVIGTGKEIGPLVGGLYEQYGKIPLYADKPGDEVIELLNLPLMG